MIIRKNSLIFAALLCTFTLTSCDEGDIVAKDEGVQTAGKTACLNATLSGTDSWSSQYNIVLAGFAEGSSNAVVQKPLQATDGTPVHTTLSLSDNDISTIELCVTNRLRQRIVTFASVPASQLQGDTVFLNVGNVDIGMFKTIQDLVFTGTCARCHGLGLTPAAGLTLIEGQSYDQLVNHPARLPENGLRVVPGSVDESLLHKVINGDPSAGVRYDHANMIKEGTTLTLIDNWIKAGARP